MEVEVGIRVVMMGFLDHLFVGFEIHQLQRVDNV